MRIACLCCSAVASAASVARSPCCHPGKKLLTSDMHQALGMYFVNGGELEYWRSALVDPVPIQTGPI